MGWEIVGNIWSYFRIDFIALTMGFILMARLIIYPLLVLVSTLILNIFLKY